LSSNSYKFIVTTAIHFATEEGNAGEPVKVQLSITSKAHKNSAPVVLNDIAVQLEGGATRIDIKHQADETQPSSNKSRIQALSLRDNQISKIGPSSYDGAADLRISPNQTIVLDFPLIIREAGPVFAKSTTISIKADQFALYYTCAPSDNDEQPVWWMTGPGGLRRRRLGREETSKVQILPRPPKMELRMPGADGQFFTDELIQLKIEVANMEDEDTEATLEVRLLSLDGGAEYSWSSPAATISEELGLPGHAIGTLAPTQTKTETISFTAPSEPAEYIVEVKVLYHLFSDRETPVSRTHSVNVQFVRAFEANYDFVPRLHEVPWPTLFGVSSLPVSNEEIERDQKGSGIMQRWHLAARIASFADRVLVLTDVELLITSISGGATALTTKENLSTGEEKGRSREIKPSEQKPSSFIIDITKSSLEDRRSTTLEMVLRITWQRESSDGGDVIISTLPIPPLSIPNSEPRVLCTRTLLSRENEGDEAFKSLNETNTLVLTYTLENPTSHFLTFDVSMESTDDFAFSGPKLRSLNLLPLSRDTVAFRILPLVEIPEPAKEQGVWIDVKLRVVDRYFKKVLRVLPASEGVKDGRAGGLGVWVGE
jgi:hypothetical protein